MNNAENYIVEYCSFCNTENEIRWDVETEGYEAFCPHCGKKMMICSECLRASDNELQTCDWFDGKCFRCTGLMNSECVQYHEKCSPNRIRNISDRIRNMSVDEMAEFLYEITHATALMCTEKLEKQGIKVSLLEAFPEKHIALHKQWLEREVNTNGTW